MAAKKAVAEYFESALGTEAAFEKADGQAALEIRKERRKVRRIHVSKNGVPHVRRVRARPRQEYEHVQLIGLLAVAASSAYERATTLKTGPEPRCPGRKSKNCKLSGLRGTARMGDAQKYSCGDCKRHFSENSVRAGMASARNDRGGAGPVLQGPRRQEDRGPHAQPESETKRPRRTTPSGVDPHIPVEDGGYASEWAPSVSQNWSMGHLHMKMRKAAHCLHMVGL